MHDNAHALPDRTRAILACDVIVSRVGRRLRSPGTIHSVEAVGGRLFSFRPRDGGEPWHFLPVNSIAGHAITVDQFSKSIVAKGAVDALWDEIEGHPVIMISVAHGDETLGDRDPLIIAKRIHLTR